jgi:thermopsin
MTRWLQSAALLVVAIAALMLVPAFFVGGASSTHLVSVGAPARAHTSSGISPTAALDAKALAAAKLRNIPTRDIFLPNSRQAPPVTNGVVSPLYTAAPAPMGLGYFGVQKMHGANVGTTTYYPSIEGAVTLNSVNPLYLASSSPDIFTLQLNTVLTHTTVLGNTSGQYWIQNVPIYFAASQTLGIEDNIWNFSSPGAGMQTTTLHSFAGQVVPGVFYYDVGPAFHMPTPFTIRLYNNASVVNLRPTVYFNYSITTSNGTVISGSYDRVEFNSAAHSTTAAAMPTFQIDGQSTNPIGLLNDAEIMIGGPGGGSTTSLFGISGSMGLWTRSNGSSTFVAVPAGSSFGTDTGETSEGIAEWTNGGSAPLAMLGPGPSLLQPLWGLVGAASGFITATFTLTPSNAFVFANQGHAFDEATAAWAPVPPSGVATYELSPHTYSFKFLLADHSPTTTTVSSTTSSTVTLATNTALGVYTPLWAWDSSQLAAISSSGTGTLAHPYTLDSNSVGAVSALFGEFNDFYYPVFPGVFIANSNAYVTAGGLPDFNVHYTLPVEAQFSAFFGTPFSNNLELQFLNDTHISLVNNNQLTGWAFSGNSFMSSVLFWNTSNSLVAGNTFQVQSLGLITSGGSGNVVWGNVFSAATTTAANPGAIQFGSAPQGFQEFNSGDLIYNNAFGTPVTAITPPFNLYTGAPQIPTDRWNVTAQAASNVRTVDGWVLTGSILGLIYQAGNWWADYGSASNPYGVRPYNEAGGILVGGDYQPLLTFSLHRIVFTESGLPATTPWSVTINGYTQTVASNSMTFWEPNGLYAYSVGHVVGFTATPSIGAVKVVGGPNSVTVTFT